MIEVDHEDALLRTYILYMQTTRTVWKYADACFYRMANLSAAKYIALQVLSANGGTMTHTELARWTNTEPHNVTTQVNRLVRDGLVETERGKRDKRFVNVTLTDRGREVLGQATPVAREIVKQVMLSIGEDNAALLEKQLRVLRRNAENGLKSIVSRHARA